MPRLDPSAPVENEIASGGLHHDPILAQARRSRLGEVEFRRRRFRRARPHRDDGPAGGLERAGKIRARHLLEIIGQLARRRLLGLRGRRGKGDDVIAGSVGGQDESARRQPRAGQERDRRQQPCSHTAYPRHGLPFIPPLMNPSERRRNN